MEDGEYFGRKKERRNYYKEKLKRAQTSPIVLQDDVDVSMLFLKASQGQVNYLQNILYCIDTSTQLQIFARGKGEGGRKVEEEVGSS